MDAINQLGTLVHRSWTRAGRDAAAFPQIAADALRAVADRIDAAALLRDLFRGCELPAQTSLTEAFGEPPVTLFRQRDFYIEILYWHTGTTGVHEHRFSGAFLVADGSSLETRYRFTEHRKLTAGFAIGDLDLVGAKLLGRGDVREIHPGKRLIHSVFHLGAPSATLVVRTPSRPGIEREYRYPHVALDPLAREPTTTKRLQLMNLMARTGWNNYVDAACDAIAHSDIVGAFHVMSRARLQLGDNAFKAVEASMRRHHKKLAEPLLLVAAEERRKWTLVTLRQTVTSLDARLFLGILLNVPDRRCVLDALAQRYPGRDPQASLAAFKQALAPVVRGRAREVYATLQRGTKLAS